MLLSVIIPLAPDEASWRGLINNLQKMPQDTEILFVASDKTKALVSNRIPSTLPLPIGGRTRF